MKLVLKSPLAEQIRQLYQEMELAYDHVASQLHFSCEGCPDNCCDSYFLHHTYIEWSYLWQGMSRQSSEKQKEILSRAAAYERDSEKAIIQGERPQIMCPLNESGRCILYRHRLMVCRTHGVPATMTRPDGRSLQFPGCFRCQDIVEKICLDENLTPIMERTALLKQLVVLEQNFLEGKKHLVPKAKMTIARMLISGPPSVPHCSDKN